MFLQPIAVNPETGETEPDALRAMLDQAAANLRERVAAEQEEARLATIKGQAENLINYREATRLADELEHKRSDKADSWARIDLGDLFDYEQQLPDVGAFIDSDTSNGGGLFYSGKVNEIHGPSESGKTMVLLEVAAQEVRAGNNVVMIDFEDSGEAIVQRLRWVFGLTREQIIRHVYYFNPEIAFGEREYQGIANTPDVTFCIIDAITESMSAAGLDGRNENEVARWYNSFPKRLAKLGWAVAIVDHAPLTSPDRQIGSQHKKSAIDGVSYTAEPIAPFVRGGAGHLRLRIAKDKPGGVRTSALPQKDNPQHWRGDFKIDGRSNPSAPTVQLLGVDPGALNIPGATGKAQDVKSVTMPTPGESQVLLVLAESTEWMANQKIVDWYNDGLDPKDPHRIVRSATHKKASKLVAKGLAERRESGASVSYRITEMGKHAANMWVNRDPETGQTVIQ